MKNKMFYTTFILMINMYITIILTQAKELDNVDISVDFVANGMGKNFDSSLDLTVVLDKNFLLVTNIELSGNSPNQRAIKLDFPVSSKCRKVNEKDEFYAGKDLIQRTESHSLCVKLRVIAKDSFEIKFDNINVKTYSQGLENFKTNDGGIIMLKLLPNRKCSSSVKNIYFNPIVGRRDLGKFSISKIKSICEY